MISGNSRSVCISAPPLYFPKGVSHRCALVIAFCLSSEVHCGFENGMPIHNRIMYSAQNGLQDSQDNKERGQEPQRPKENLDSYPWSE